MFLGENTNDFSVNLLNKFSADNDGMVIHEKTIITISSKAVTLYSCKGSIIATLTSGLSEGEPIGMDVTGQYLTVFTMEGFLKIYDLSETEPRLTTPVRNLYDTVPDFGEIIQAKTNSTGNRVAMTLAAANLIPDGKLYIWDVESDDIAIYDFRKYDFADKSDADGMYANEESEKGVEDRNDAEEIKQAFDGICRNRIPLTLFWDVEDPRLLVCNARKLKMSTGKNKGFLMRSKSMAGKSN